MTTQAEPEIVLYDLACTKNVCFSPAVWRTRLLLNYKQIPYKTVFVEFPDIEPTLKDLGLPPHDPASGSPVKYTVPAIYHVPSNTYMMDSTPIAQFLESTYPEPPLPLTSELGNAIQSKLRSVVGATFRSSVTPREIHILPPRSQEYFRRRVEASLGGGRRIEDMLPSPEEEDESWRAVDGAMAETSQLIRTHAAEGPFILGARPSYADFFIAGSLQSARRVHEGTFQRNMKYPGLKAVYEACLPYMEKDD
ncbi:hypothetical protein BX600DRAFT_549875 [Xylariales sp. PMI_506]|nr:hypothetical protein BX600DRAFT_549875 [Xylariales sp. PMI_506]